VEGDTLTKYTLMQGDNKDSLKQLADCSKACMLEGFNFIGMELNEEYVKIAEARIKHVLKEIH
jgi:DNA modification methylase